MAAGSNALFPLGSKWIIRDTDRNRLNNLVAHKSVYLTHASGPYFSIVSLQAGMPEMRVPRAMWGVNFKRALAGEIAKAYIGSSPAKRLYK